MLDARFPRRAFVPTKPSAQCARLFGRLPDVLLACVGAAPMRLGLFHPFVNDPFRGWRLDPEINRTWEIKNCGEAAGEGRIRAIRLSARRPKCTECSRAACCTGDNMSLLLQDAVTSPGAR